MQVGGKNTIIVVIMTGNNFFLSRVVKAHFEKKFEESVLQTFLRVLTGESRKVLA